MQKQRDKIPVRTANDGSARHLSFFFILIQKLCHLYPKRFPRCPVSLFFFAETRGDTSKKSHGASGRNAACRLNGQSERDARRSGWSRKEEEESKGCAIIWSSNVAATRATTRASVMCASAVPALWAAVCGGRRER
jgi:hypothetical protein